MGAATASAEATAKLAELQEQRGRAVARVDDLEREMREAGAAAAQASAALIEYERKGGPAARRRELEQTLAAAKAKAGEPWSERIEGARQSVRDLDQRLRQYVAQNLPELLAAKEADGDAAAERVNQLAAEFYEAWLARERIAAEIGGLISRVSAPGPSDVSHSAADQAAAACRALLDNGGERPVVLDRTRPPWDRLLGSEAPAEAVPA